MYEVKQYVVGVLFSSKFLSVWWGKDKKISLRNKKIFIVLMVNLFQVDINFVIKNS